MLLPELNNLDFFDTQEIFTYKKLPFDILPCTTSVVREYYPHKPDFKKFAHYKIPNNLLDSGFIKILDLANLKVKHVEVFYRPGTGVFMDAFIHTDGHRIVPSLAKINYILGSTGNLMQWWRPEKVDEKNNMFTPIGTKYLRFSKNECALLNEVDMSGLYVINAGIPHSVSMSAGSIDQPRICISVTPLDGYTGNNIDCSTVVKRLESAVLTL